MNNIIFYLFQKISIPAPASGNGQAGEATFHFSINSNAEMEGPQVKTYNITLINIKKKFLI